MENNNPSEKAQNNEEMISENTQEGALEQEVTDLEGGEQASELVKVQAELAGAKDKYIRLYSEFENFRRRTAKEKIEMVSTANEQVIKSLLPVVDDFERAEKSIQTKDNKEIEGYLLISSKFKKILEQAGVKVMAIEAGAEFNADFHEAITQIPASPELKGKIVDVVEKGYLLNEKVIRFAKVVVGS